MGDIIQLRCDSILNLLVKEKDPDRKADLILAFYGTSIDGFPLQLLVLSQLLRHRSPLPFGVPPPPDHTHRFFEKALGGTLQNLRNQPLHPLARVL